MSWADKIRWNFIIQVEKFTLDVWTVSDLQYEISGGL